MGEFLGLLIILLVVGGFIWSLNPDNYKPKRQKEREKYYDRLNCTVTPRWDDAELALCHPDSTVVVNASLRLGHDWHVIVTPWDPVDFQSEDSILALLYDTEWFIACTGQAVQLDSFTPLLATFHNLNTTITCPTCLANMTRLYTVNGQPHYTNELYPQQGQLMLTPDLVDWDITKLHTPKVRKNKHKTAQAQLH